MKGMKNMKFSRGNLRIFIVFMIFMVCRSWYALGAITMLG